MIHKTSIVDKNAKISSDVNIGPFCFIGPNVELKDGVSLISNVHIEGNTSIGKGTKIFPFASIGTQPQDLKFKNEPNSLTIGENNTIREYVTINPGTESGGSKTVIGNNCLFMISSHVAHDCNVGNNVIIANNVPLGGHVTIEDNVVIGGNSAVQQFTRIGQMAMIGGMTGVLHDVIPYGLSIGNRNYLQGLNLIGLRRANFENKDILGLTEAYKEIFATKNLTENLNKLNGEFKENPLVKKVIESINTSRETAIKIGTENAHEDYMFVTETRMAVGEEVVEEWEKEFERDKYRIEDYKLIHEDQDIILWKELGSYGNGKRVIKTVSMFLREGKIWRETENRRFVEDSETLSEEPNK